MDRLILADLLAHWERGEMRLEEVIARWPRKHATTDELLQELLRALVGVLWRVIELESEKGNPSEGNPSEGKR